MKHNVMPSIVQMGQEELKQLVQEVKETVATEMSKPVSGKNSIKVKMKEQLQKGQGDIKFLIPSLYILLFN